MSNYGGENWMEGISGEKLLSEINIPGTHDSGTKNVENGRKDKYQCQNLSIFEQMKIGVRYFDIRCVDKENQRDEQFINHEKIACFNESGGRLTLGEVIKAGKDFLQKNRTETLIFQIKNEDGGGNDEHICSYLEKYIHNNEIWSNSYIPRLKEVRGKIVLVRRFTFKEKKYRPSIERYGIDLSSWDTNCGWGMYTNTFVHVKDNAWVQDRYFTYIKDKIELITKAVDEMNNSEKKHGPRTEWAICLSSCISLTTSSPLKCSEKINSKLLSNQSPINAKKIGTFVVDFATEALIKKIYMTNF